MTSIAATQDGDAAPAGRPVDDRTFDRLMAGLGPFEPSPVLAVAVSGGPDSMALCLLAERWARSAGGTVLALTVDHGLRPQSADEAAAVAGWTGRRGVAHRTLVWNPGRVTGSPQAAAREARYALLERACAETGILHLLLAHTLDDQAETVLLRLAKGSGVDGLAAMPAIRETSGPRLLRPLLGVPKSRLQATCRQHRQDWLDDPTNRAERFARGRLRRVSAALAREGLSPDRLADTARRAGRARAALEDAAAGLLADAVALYPEGYALLDRERLLAAADELALRALSRCLVTVGGGVHPPRLERLERLFDALRRDQFGAGRTLSGCRILPVPAGGWLVCREPAAAAPMAVPEDPGPSRRRVVAWDGRFRVALPPGPLPPALMVRRLGIGGRAALRSAGWMPDRVPPAAALSLPGLWDGDRLFALPKFVTLQRRPDSAKLPACGVAFVPLRRLTGPAFAVV